jgi:hypothetical protein
MKHRKFGLAMTLGVACATLAACSKAPPAPPPLDPAAVADTLYVGGDIVTVNDAQPAAEALAVKDVVVVETVKDGKTIYTKS